MRVLTLVGVVVISGVACGGGGSNGTTPGGGGDDAGAPDGAGVGPDGSTPPGDGASAHPDGSSSGGGEAGSPGWHTLKIGAGGFVQGVDISSDGTRVIRTDTYGAYLFDSASGLWQQLITKSSMPSSAVSVGTGDGVYALAIAPSNTMRFYMTFNGAVFRSDDRGASWTQTAFTPDTNADANDGYRGFGRKIAVDPANPDVVYAGVPSGLFTTSNGGSTWSRVTSVPLPSNDGAVVIAFDPSSGTSGGKTKGIYASSYGSGVYHSTDAGATWPLTPGSPTTHEHLVVGQDGVAYLTDDGGGGSNLHAFANGAWSTLGAGNVWSIAVDPASASHLVAGGDNGAPNVSSDHGMTWTGSLQQTRDATDVPWLGWTNESWMSNGDQVFDPKASNTLWFGEGVGVWSTSPPSSSSATVSWTSVSAGIEQLVPNWIVSPPGGHPILTAWDRPVFTVLDPNGYPGKHGVNNKNEISLGASADWASTSPSTIVVIANGEGNSDTSGYSSDGGMTWDVFGSNTPATQNGTLSGCIAASTATNFVWVPTDNGSSANSPWTTSDGGKSWKAASVPGVPASGETGWSFAYYLDRQIAAADRVTAGTFYLYNYGPKSAPAAAGFYESTDGGTTWKQVSTMAIPNGSYNAQMRSVPGQAGHLFFTAGSMSPPHPSTNQFYRSTDGGTTWTAVSGMQEVWSFGFGKAAPSKTYPAIYAYGWYMGTLGLWHSDDDAQTWKSISDGYPNGSLAPVKVLEGDSDTYGTVYVGLGGDGWADFTSQ